MEKEFIKDISVSKLKPYERNPRKNKHAVDALAKSIQRVGNNDPIEVNEDYVILCGHTRKQALEKLNIRTTDVIMIKGLTEDQQNEYRITNNKTGEIAEWDFEVLEEDFSVEELVEFGFDIKDLTKPEVVEDEPPPAPEIPRTVRGDIYQLGNHRVMCGDSTMIDDVEKLMDGKKSDMVFTDPPYNVDYSGRGKNTSEKIKNDNMIMDDFHDFLTKVFINYSLFSKTGACLYVCHADGKPMIRATFEKVFNDCFTQSCTIIWKKNVAPMGWQDYRCQHEPILYGWNNGEHKFYGNRSQTTIWEVSREGNYAHPTQKPVELIIKAIHNSSKDEDLIIDFFGGSGSTLIACEQTNRICYSMELDEKYCDVIVQRWVNFTGGNVFLNGQKIEWEKDNV